MTEGKSEPARVAAATALLDRGWGKPTQPIAGDHEAGPVRIARIERVIVPLAQPALDEASRLPAAVPGAH